MKILPKVYGDQKPDSSGDSDEIEADVAVYNLAVNGNVTTVKIMHTDCIFSGSL